MMRIEGNKRGKESDKILLEVIREYPGLSQYELKRKLNWHSGHVDSSVRRLLKSNNVFLRVMERNGRHVNLVYPKDQKPLNIIEVPIELLKVNNPTWNEHAFMYALDSSTIGVSGKEILDWAEISCFHETISLQREEGKIIFRLPEKFWRFYNLERKHKVISINGNNILITISGNIIEEKRYPS